jgi:hypothetical protein
MPDTRQLRARQGFRSTRAADQTTLVAFRVAGKTLADVRAWNPSDIGGIRCL